MAPNYPTVAISFYLSFVYVNILLCEKVLRKKKKQQCKLAFLPFFWNCDSGKKLKPKERGESKMSGQNTNSVQILIQILV